MTYLQCGSLVGAKSGPLVCLFLITKILSLHSLGFWDYRGAEGSDLLVKGYVFIGLVCVLGSYML